MTRLSAKFIYKITDLFTTAVLIFSCFIATEDIFCKQIISIIRNLYAQQKTDDYIRTYFLSCKRKNTQLQNIINKLIINIFPESINTNQSYS